MFRLPALVLLSLLIHGMAFILVPAYTPPASVAPEPVLVVELERRMRQPVTPAAVARELPRRSDLAGDDVDLLSGRTVQLPQATLPDDQVREFSVPVTAGVFGQREMRDSSLERNRRLRRPTPPAELNYVEEHIEELFAQRHQPEQSVVVPEITSEQVEERIQITGDLSRRKILFTPAFPVISAAYAVSMEIILFVEPSGLVSQTNVLRNTGNSELDMQGVVYARRFRFEPLPVSHVQRGTLVIEFIP